MKYLFILLLLSLVASAATIQGTVYDLGLNELSDAVVEINTTPAQRVVVKDAAYSFEVALGTYELTAVKGELNASEIVVVSDDGSYTFDLILIPAFEAGLIEGLELPDVDPLIQESSKPLTQWLGWVALFLLIAFMAFRFSKSKHVVASVNGDLERIISFLDEQGGRATQKEIRKLFPYSEAKVSLMISELESKELVERFKKGRSKVVVKK